MTEHGALPPILIIGIGNTLRRDDGAGWLFAEALAAALRDAGEQTHLLLLQQLTPEVAADLDDLRPADVIFVDASMLVAAATLTPLTDVVATPAASHHLTPVALLAIAQRLYAVTAHGWLLQTPAVDFAHGEGLSAAAQQGITVAPAVAARFLALR